MNKRVLLFNSQKVLLGRVDILDGRISADVSQKRFGEGYEEFLGFLKDQEGVTLSRREQEKSDEIIAIKRVLADGDTEKLIAFSEIISRKKFSFGRVFAVVGTDDYEAQK